MSNEDRMMEIEDGQSSRAWLWIALGAAAVAGIAAVVLARRRECAESVDMLLDTCNNALSALDERLMKTAS